MLSADQRQEAARLLLQAEREVKPVTQLDVTFPGIDIEDAYAIQQAVVAEKMAGGAKLRGHKIGLTSKAMQRSVGIDEPDYGHLLDDMFFEDGATIPVARFIVPRVEVELAFVLGEPLRGPGVTLFDVLRATEYVVPALELIDGRSQYPRRLVDNISDNAACGGVILGGRPVRPMDVDLRWVAAVLSRNGVIEESGVSAAVLGHPAMGVAWLANKLAPFDTALEAGHVVLAGSFTRMVSVQAGDTIHADYGPLGSIAVHFA
ncbi:2-oxo-hepta-3-ene-1,7-dioic acid hydratase [Achromobacter sp. GG226]|uniref:2-oxo-hept-4-ene-1,7-dioate hydratase n=1 Tax=Verticiella alkaliphila TaxID=2779529 RepID=UPI001C0C37A0|nr:2-oxo-hepta-3-ene-1,7-dioic acid hydratase [Verticiella sp. GG226]MBU4612283.1 2-oxo-hepta-3-ene-1,7-dioic acid hydratase [Verticiella sp. GG226]